MNNNEGNNYQPQVPIYNPEITVDNSKNTNKKTSYIIIIILLILVISVIVFFLFINNKDNEEPVNNTEKEKVEENNNDIEVNLDNWIGVYSSGDNTVTIYSYENQDLSIDILYDGNLYGFNINEFNNNKIEYTDDNFGDKDNIIIERSANSNGILVTASSSNSDSILNSISGEYNKNVFNNYGWSGTYKYNNSVIVLNEVDENRVICRITSGSYTSGEGMSISEFTFRDVGINDLKYEGFDDEVINITKTDSGIKVDASSKIEDDIFNKISGNYIKD